jgi:nifR3 family TIM-barrel protein
MGIQVGPVRLKNKVFLAPMSGVTDAAFRKVADRCGAGLVVSEMVASEELARSRPDMVRRTAGKTSNSPFVIQLAGREAKWMAEGARIAEGLGADIIDINMGCPARQVTGGLSGSALMRDPAHALSLVAATVAATSRPVTLKMRLGWDHSNLNAPAIAKRAEEAGVRMITVHGRTRCQFYTGKADWAAIRAVREATTVPLVANGDGGNAEDARLMLNLSGADAVMFGRSCYGRPWWPAVVAESLENGTGRSALSLAEELDYLLLQLDETLSLYGAGLGNKIFRKHLGWTLERLQSRGFVSPSESGQWRAEHLRQTDHAKVRLAVQSIYELACEREGIYKAAA